MILLATTAAIMPLFGGAGDPQYAIQGTGLVLCILGAGLLLPFDGRRMLAPRRPRHGVPHRVHAPFPPQNLPVVIATVCAAVIATVGADACRVAISRAAAPRRR